jgi:DNA end-binding protein Ku
MGNPVGRSTWSGSISFGMVIVPVKLYTATETHDVAFKQVHREDGGRVQYRRFCSADGAEVAYSDIAKGYELADGNIVVLGDDDLKDLPLPTLKTMEVLQFVDAEKINPLLHGKSYYVLPGIPAAGGAFGLLLAAMRQRNVSGLVKVALRQRETLGLLSEREGALVLTLLLWPDEVREAPKADPLQYVNPALIDQAVSLIDVMTAPFDPGEHTDTYEIAVNEMVTARIADTPARPSEHPVTGPPANLAEILLASVAAAKEAQQAA